MNVAYLNNIIIGEAVPLYVVLSETYNENSENAIKRWQFPFISIRGKKCVRTEQYMYVRQQ